MHNQVEAILYMGGGILRLFDLVTDIWYIQTQVFATETLYYLSIVSVIAPSLVFMLLFTYMGLINLCKGNSRLFIIQLLIGLVTALLEPLGIVLCAFSCFLVKTDTKKYDFYIIEAITRSAGFVEGVFESLPSIVIQTYNNIQNNSWTYFTICSLGFSAFGVIYTCIKLMYAYDIVQNHDSDKEVVSDDQKTSKVHSNLRASNREEQPQVSYEIEFVNEDNYSSGSSQVH